MSQSSRPDWCDELIRKGEVKNFAELASLGQVCRTRVTQIMNLLLLAPDIQEAILFLPRIEKGADILRLKELQIVAKMANWSPLDIGVQPSSRA